MEAVNDDGVPSVSEVWEERLVLSTLQPLLQTGRRYWLWVTGLSLVVLWGVFAYSVQIRHGLVVTNMRDRISWGLYISAFVFFIGISHAGTLISAILRVSHATWRASVTRIAELVTSISLICGAVFVIIDMGRPERMLNLVTFGRLQSPILWDVMAVTTYLSASIVYLFVPMVPDLALLRDRISDDVGPFRRGFYRIASINWRGDPQQHSALQRALRIMMLLIIPVAIFVHTAVSWIFGMTLRTGWDTSIFGVLFVAGAIFSGIAALVLIMAVLRLIFHWEEYLTSKQFINLGYLLATFGGIMVYVNILEYLTAGFKLDEADEFAFRQLFLEKFSYLFWFYVFGLFAPVLLMMYRKTRTIAGVVVSAALVLAAMFIERYLIVVTGLRVPLMSYEPANYFPSWVEWSILAGMIAAFLLLLSSALKILPMFALAEMVEEQEEAEAPRSSWGVPGATSSEEQGPSESREGNRE